MVTVAPGTVFPEIVGLLVVTVAPVGGLLIVVTVVIWVVGPPLPEV